jgi:CubicO group peptidase (beta-lactamase class C family)
MTLAHAVVRDGTLSGVDAATIVPWWSFTKTVIAAAALTLVRDDWLALDRPLSSGYTLRQLLQHRAGLPDYGPLRDYHAAVARHEDAWPVAELLERAHAQRLIYPPGTGWAYSNIGYYFVRRLIEAATGKDLGTALASLVLQPLGIQRARFASERADLDGVAGVHDYDPRWVYHGLLVGPLADAALLLDRLMAGRLLPNELISAMTNRHPLDVQVAGRPWVAPGYGLGMMIGDVAGGERFAGHTGGGPGSVVAVYHALSGGPACTAAAFLPGDDQGAVESGCFALLSR